MRIPHTITKCYEALGLVPLGRGDLSKGRLEPKAKLCKNLISEFLHNTGNLVFEGRDKLDQFQERAKTFVGLNASKLWAATDRANLFPGAPTYPRDKDMITEWVLHILAHRISFNSKRENARELAEQQKTNADALAEALNPPKKAKWKKAEDMDPDDPRLISHDNGEIFETLVTDSEAEQGPAKPKEAVAAKEKSPAKPTEAKTAVKATPPNPTAAPAATAAKEKQPPTTPAPRTKSPLKRAPPSNEASNAPPSKKPTKRKPTSETPSTGHSTTNPPAPALALSPPPPPPTLPPTYQAPAHGLTAVHLDQTYILAKLATTPLAEPLSLRACLECPSIYAAVLAKLGIQAPPQWASAKLPDCEAPVAIAGDAQSQEMLVRYVRAWGAFGPGGREMGFLWIVVEVGVGVFQ